MSYDYSDEQEQVSEDILKRVSAKADELAVLMRQEEALKEQFEDMQKRVRSCREFDLPELMTEAGLSDFTTKSGFRVTLKEKIRVGQIDNDAKPDAIRYVEEQGEGDLIKTEVGMSFARGQREKAIELLEHISSLGYTGMTLKETIHAQTTMSFLKRKLEAGEDVPLNLFGAFIQKYADVKMPKRA